MQIVNVCRMAMILHLLERPELTILHPDGHAATRKVFVSISSLEPTLIQQSTARRPFDASCRRALGTPSGRPIPNVSPPKNRIGLDWIWAIRDDTGRIRCSALCVPSPGRTVMVFMSPMTRQEDVPERAALVRHVLAELRAHPLDLAQVLLARQDDLACRAHLEGGFRELAACSTWNAPWHATDRRLPPPTAWNWSAGPPNSNRPWRRSSRPPTKTRSTARDCAASAAPRTSSRGTVPRADTTPPSGISSAWTAGTREPSWPIRAPPGTPSNWSTSAPPLPGAAVWVDSFWTTSSPRWPEGTGAARRWPWTP